MAKKKKIQIQLGGLLGSISVEEWIALQICNDILSGIAKSDILDECKSYPQSAGGNERDRLRDTMIKILEEKLGCKVIVPKEVEEKREFPPGTKIPIGIGKI